MFEAMLRGPLVTLALAGPILVAPLPALADGHVLASGTFTGASRHVTKGTTSVVKRNDKVTVVPGAELSFDGAPDPKVGFGKNGVYDAKARLAHLASNTGKQTYVAPASIDVSGSNEVYIWCEKFSVPLGVAKRK